jgi:hypothetical protein
VFDCGFFSNSVNAENFYSVFVVVDGIGGGPHERQSNLHGACNAKSYNSYIFSSK